ncbi:MAG: hypothetical protein Kow00120_20680 [Anaerolineae bacterium]
MTDQQPDAKPFAHAGGMAAAGVEQRTEASAQMMGTMFLGLIALFGFFALLRAQRRNRDLLRELMALQAERRESAKT